jgi:hypothetical protein
MYALHVAALVIGCLLSGLLIVNFWKVGGKKKRERDEER